MPNPTKYTPSYSFSGFQSSNPKTPLPAPRLDDELANVSQSIGGLVDGLGDIRRSDGKLKNEVVTLLSLSPEVRAAIDADGGSSGGGTTPGGPIDIDDVTGLSDALAGKQAALGFTPEDRTNRGKAGGYASLGSDGKVPAAQLPASGGGSNDAADIIFRPLSTPSLAIPVAERLGAEVFLTDGYKAGDQLADFTALAKSNLARAIADKKPFVIPQGTFLLREQLVGLDTGISIFGYGKTLSALQWAADATSSGLRFLASSEIYKPDFMHFRDFALYTEQECVGEALYASFEKQIRDNSGNPVVLNRYSTRFRAQDVTIQGAQGSTGPGAKSRLGWLKGITCLYEIDAILRDVQFEGGIDGTEPNYMSDHAFYIGGQNGYGHPTGPFVDTCNVFHAKRAVVFEGNEGGVVTNSQLVGVNVGVDFVDNAGRPLLMCTNNHINAFSDCIRADAASQIQIIGNSLYQTIGAQNGGRGVSIAGTNARSQHAIICNNVFESAIGTTAIFTGIVIFGCDHGVIDGNTFRTGVVSPSPSNMKGIVLGANARFFKVGANNVYEDPQSGRPALISALEDGGVENRLPAMGARYTKSGGQYASGETVISFDLSESIVGGVESVADGGFTCRVPGLWHFTFGVVAQATSGGQVLAIKKNGLGTTALVSDSKDYQGSTPISMHVTTGPVLMNKGDTVYPVFNTPGTTVNVHPATFFEARRLG